MDGGSIVADVLQRRGTRFVFTLCGGHISPILVAARRRGIRVIDVRHEVSAVFAADAVARLGGGPGVAIVTAGPGATNTITAVKNAGLAQSPVVVLGGATATILRGRGSLQDIDQLALMRPHVKSAVRVRRRRDIARSVAAAIDIAGRGVPGPVFVELPVDLLYPDEAVRELYGLSRESRSRGLRESLQRRFLEWHLRRILGPGGGGAGDEHAPRADAENAGGSSSSAAGEAAALLARARRPVMLVGSQAAWPASGVREVVGAIERIGAPTFLSGMARGLLGADHPLLVRHRRREALREADVVVLAGVPCDFRLDYGRQIPRPIPVIAANRSRADLRRNRRPAIGVEGPPGAFLAAVARALDGTPSTGDSSDRDSWIDARRRTDRDREEEIERMAGEATPPVNPLALCRAIDSVLGDDSVIVADGGDFVGTASYIVRPRGPLSWLDPGPFGTLGVGGGFALGAVLCRPTADVWLLWGDGSAAYSLMELDTFVRHGLSVIAVVGNDACWSQIERAQVAILGDDVATTLARNDYHTVAAGWGARGVVLDDGEPDAMTRVLTNARDLARSGTPVLVNAHIGKTAFRSGSISL